MSRTAVRCRVALALLGGLVPALALTSSPPATAKAATGDGVRWEADLDAGLARAAREGRPVFLAVNALEDERANQQLATLLYPSAAWGEATHDYVCFVANGGDHPGTGGTCARYGAPLRCETHRAALRYAIRRFSPVEQSLISPQHVILEPDGAVAFRKEYFTGVVGPELLAKLFVELAPEHAYRKAGVERARKVDELDDLPGDEAEAAERAWLATDDPLATAGVLCAIDYAQDDARQLRLLGALDAAPASGIPLLEYFADGLGAEPDDQPEQTLALADVLLGKERLAGARLLARIARHTKDAALRERALDRWKNAGPPSGKGADEERALRLETRLLLGRTDGAAPDETGLSSLWRARLLRARKRAGLVSRRFPPLAEALEKGPPGALAGALLEATPEEVGAEAEAVRRLLKTDPGERVGYAAALALLGAGIGPAAEILPWVFRAATDPLEGPEMRLEAVRRLGADPGYAYDAWAEAVSRRLEGGR